MKRARWAAPMVLACTMAMLACNDSSTSPVTTTGTFALQSIDGLAPPVVVTLTGGSTVIYAADTAFLYSNHTWKQDIVLQATVGGSTITQTTTQSGTYSQTGDTFTFTDPTHNTVTTGTLANGTMTIVEDNTDTGNGAVTSLSKGTTTITAGTTITLVYHQL